MLKNVLLSLALVVLWADSSFATPPGALGYWSFDAGDARDDVGSNDGILNGAVSSAGAVNPEDSGVMFGLGMSFDGINDEILIPGATIDPVTSPQGFTVMAWAFADDLLAEGVNGGNNVRPIVAKRRVTGSTVDNQFLLTFDGRGGDDRAHFFLADSTGNTAVSAPFGSIQINMWYLMTGVYDPVAQEKRLYLNDELVASAPQTSLPPAASGFDIFVGGKPALGIDWFDGRIDEVAVFDRALTLDEIQQAYGLPPPIPALRPTGLATLLLTLTLAGLVLVRRRQGAVTRT